MLNVLDTFAGAGGFSLGFAMAGCPIVGAIESDRWACDTFEANHPETNVICADIRSMSTQSLRRAFRHNWPQVVLGGPPCQGFSVCVRNPGDPKDPRNSLFRELLRVAKVFSPEFVVMENVPRLEMAQTARGQPVIEIICGELEEMGYHAYHCVLEATDFGVPQIRKRLFVIGSKQRLAKPFPKPTHIAEANGKPGVVTLWDAISDLPRIDSGESGDGMPYRTAPKNQYQKAMRRGAHELTNHTAMRHSPRIIERFAAMVCGDRITDVPWHLRPRRRNSEAIADTVYDQNNRRLHADRPCHTLPASFYANFVHPKLNRNFTPREGARIQSFPDSYVFKGKPTVVSHALLAREGRTDELFLCQYNQIGNAVPPLLAKSVAANLLRRLSLQSNKSASSKELAGV